MAKKTNEELREWEKVETESIIADVVNMTIPSDDQMKTVRYLRKTLPKMFFLISEKTESSLKERWIKDIEGMGGKYPVDLFPEPLVGWQNKLDEWCKTQGYRIDRISAHFARWQEKLVLDDVIRKIKGEENHE